MDLGRTCGPEGRRDDRPSPLGGPKEFTRADAFAFNRGAYTTRRDAERKTPGASGSNTRSRIPLLLHYDSQFGSRDLNSRWYDV